MITRLFLPKHLRMWLAALIVLATMSPLRASTALAQGTPPACLNDQGNTVLPAPVMGAWVLTLNFNHAPTLGTTKACRATTTGVNPLQVSFTMINCQVRNNPAGIQVGGGQAAFDGNFGIQCPGGPSVPGQGPLYTNFFVSGDATFSTSGAAYTLLQHQDVGIRVEVDANWHVKLRSRYGSTDFEHQDNVTNVNGMQVSLTSLVNNGGGSHFVNSTELQPSATVAPFSFAFNQPFSIGSPGQIWTLYQIIIDPPPSRCCFSD